MCKAAGKKGRREGLAGMSYHSTKADYFLLLPDPLYNFYLRPFRDGPDG